MRKLILFIYVISGKKFNYDVYKSIVNRYINLLDIKTSEYIRLSITDFLRILVFPFLFFLRLKRNKQLKAIYYEMSHTPYIHNRRVLHIAKNTHLPKEAIGIINNKVISYRSNRDLIAFIPGMISIWLLAIGASFIGLFVIHKKNISLYTVLSNYSALMINRHVEHKIIYDLFAPEVYTFAFLTGYRLRLKISSSNSILYQFNRCIYLPEAILLICSKFQIEELKLYKKNGWIKYKTDEFWGLEEVDIYDADETYPKTEKYDIGFYSSGEWARKGGLERALDMDKLKAGFYYDNPANLFSINLIQHLINYATAKKKKLCIYLHPFERELMRDYQIIPPYLTMLKDTDTQLIFSDTQPNKISNIFECNVGISLFSTTIWDRFNFDKTGYLAEIKGYEFMINPTYLGSYRNYTFKNPEELTHKLDLHFGL